MVSYNQDDLQFILDQIIIAERHAAGESLTDLIPNPLLPWGLRTVDGSNNNIIEGREEWGSADQTFPRLLDPEFRDADPFPFDPDGPGPLQAGGTSSYQQTSGLVFDSQPRIISNLVVDQTLNNPAAITAALKFAGITGSEAAAAVQQITVLYEAIKPLEQDAQTAQTAETQAQANLAAAQQALADAQAADAGLTATLTAYGDAVSAANQAVTGATAVGLIATALQATLADGAPGVQEIDRSTLETAEAASAQLVSSANAIIAALQAAPGLIPADLTAAQNFLTLATQINTAFTSIDLEDNSVDAFDDIFSDIAVSLAPGVSTAAQALLTQLDTSETTLANSNPAIADALAAVEAAQAALDAATAASDSADAALSAAQDGLASELGQFGLELTDNGSLVIPNVAPDEGISAPFNSWMTLFGQFFDHGLDLVGKGGSGTVFVPLQPDDPLYVPGSHTNFMVLTRATNQPGPDGVLGTADDIREHTNSTTPFVDQNQTYTSHASHQVFLREYVMRDGVPVATGHLLEGPTNGGLATWADVKTQARDLLGINLTDADVTNVPLLATDDYGRFIRGENGFAQVVMDDGNGGFVLVEGDPTNPIDLANAVRTGHAFLDDIAHAANPFGDHDGNPSTPNQFLTADEDTDTGGSLDIPARGTYDNELLDRHFIAGDGRGNENIGLTAVHHVFHSEHNRLAEHTKDVVIATGNLAFINQWLLTPITADQIPTTPEGIDALDWNGERLFQAARFGTEMQYQHLVFEEFARKVNPAVDLFVFNPTMDVDPAIFAEFAHVVYRFGHSMLNETVDRLGADGKAADDIGLIEAFLNPVEFDKDGALTADQAAGAIVRGMTRQQGNEIDEFVTEALRNNLLGLPLDLATINMTRARETGVPSLNAAREQFFEMTGSEWLKPYESWVDFAQSLKNPASIVNFIAAYGTHEAILAAQTLDEKRAAATAIVFGDDDGSPNTVTIGGEEYDISDRVNFLNGTSGHAALGGLNDVDFWIGGLAEAILPFGGMLGSTFTFVFEMQMENLQNGDRFYYLSRTQGLHFLTELENNAFSKIIMKNTDLGEEGATHLPGEIFARVDHILEVNQDVQLETDPVHDDPILAALQPKVFRDTNVTVDGNQYDNMLKFTGGEHVVLGGTNQSDVLIGDLGDDTLWGDGGDDYLIGGHGINRLHGGAGDDIIYDGGDPAFIHGDEGNDAISGGSGLGELIFAGTGHDFVIGGIDGKEVFGAEGNDFILGSPDVDFLLGGEGDDWIEGGEGFDTIAGENSQLFFNSSIVGHDVMFAGTNESDFDAESGDDIMVQGESVMRNEGMLGFDWAIFKDMPLDAYADMRIPIFTTVEADILRNRFDRTEALSGWENNDTLIGDDRVQGTGVFDPAIPPEEANFDGDGLTRAGVERIAGLQQVLGLTNAQLAAFAADDIVFDRGNILIGGGGGDIIEGRAGDDIIDGDAWLNVRIGIMAEVNGALVEIGTTNYMQEAVQIYDAHLGSFGHLNGQPLDQLIFARALNPSQLSIVREILDGNQAGDVDIAVFSGARTEYDVTDNGDGTWTVAHTRAAANGGGVNDGTDTLRNIEVLQFADGIENIGAVPNSAATGELALIDSTPGTPAAVGDTFTVALGTVADADVVPPLSEFEIVWQVEETPGLGDWVNIENPVTDTLYTQLSFTPTSDLELEGLRIRALATFVGGNGIPEVVMSAPTVALAAQTLTPATNGDDIIFGTVGPDVIDALAGDDEVFAFAGNDTITGGPGNDVIDGGDGIDTAIFGGLLADFAFATTPEGTIEVIDNATGEEDELISIEQFQFSDGILTVEQVQAIINGGLLPIMGTAGADTLNGTLNADLIDGLGGNDTINGLGGDDTLNGGDGHDAINGGGGIDTIDGGDGNDAISGGAGDDIIAGGAGLDNILGNGGNDTIAGGAGADFLSGGGGSDVLSGDGGADEIHGGTGADILNGGAAGDLLFGEGGNDTLNGDGGNDVLDGGAGRDVLNGGNGDDVLIGGAGVDSFVFAGNNFGNDTIVDFDDVGGGQDLIDLTFFNLTGIQDLTIETHTVGAIITVGTTANPAGTIVVQGLNPADLDENDFTFA